MACAPGWTPSDPTSFFWKGGGSLLEPVDLDFIDIAPAPAFSRLQRLNNRVLRLVEVLGGVLIL